MSPKEFSDLTNKFTIKIKNKCKKENILFGILQQKGNQIVYRLGQEAYELTNTGDVAYWKYLGVITIREN